MKTRFLVIVGIIIIAISGLYFFIVMNQNDTRLISNIDCSDGGIQIGDKCVPSNSKEKIDYDDLVTRKVLAVSAPATEIIPERNCHKFSPDELASIPPDLEFVISEAVSPYPDDYDGDGFYDGFGNEVSFETAKLFLEKYDFALTKETREWGFQNIPDTKYTFECIFEDDSHQYKLGFVFEPQYETDVKIIFVNFTQNELGLPIILNKDITIFGGGFNGTVAFANNLDHAITLQIQNPPTDGDWTEHLLPNSVTIPAGKVWSHLFRNFHSGNDLVYTYFISPENLDGKVTFKNYPRCMTENEVKSLYSQVDVHPIFPRYVPQGYWLECGVHHTNFAVNLVFFNDKLRDQFSDNVNAAYNYDFFESGGLAIYYSDNAFNRNVDPAYDKFEYAKSMESKFTNSTEINENPAVFIKEYFWRDGKSFSFNSLRILLDDQVFLEIKGGISKEEIIKIAESML